MRDHVGDILGYYVSHEAWYAHHLGANAPDVTFGYYAPEGGTTGEMSMIWDGVGPKLRIYHDAFHAFSTFCDRLMAELKEYDDSTFTVHDFTAILDKLGFVDLTKRTRE